MPVAERATAVKQRRWIVNGLLLLLSLLVFDEGGARLVFSIPRLRHRILAEDSASFRLQWVTSWRSQVLLRDRIGMYNSTRGWALRPNVREFKDSDGTLVNTNTRGIRGTKEYMYQRIRAKSRIVLLGDSYSYGSEVSDDTTFARTLEGMLPSTEVINLAVPAYGHDQMLLYFKEEGAKYHPDVVLLGFVYLDIYRNVLSFFAFAKPQFSPLAGGGLRLRNVPVPTPEHILSAERYRSKAFDLLQILAGRVAVYDGSRETAARSVTKLILGEIVKAARGIRAEPVFVFMPNGDEIDKRVGARFVEGMPAVQERETYFEEICTDQRIRCVSLLNRFTEETRKGRDFNPQHHWNGNAHALAAQELAGVFRDLGFR